VAAPNGLELSRPDALGSPSPTLQPFQRQLSLPFSAAVRVGSSELLGGPENYSPRGFLLEVPNESFILFMRPNPEPDHHVRLE